MYLCNINLFDVRYVLLLIGIYTLPCRILVTAPTNHAADVIAEQLVRSRQYHPGEFIRFNGFMRHEQGIMDSIKDYCVDGEFLDSVARNRLIVSTCATAGQFFALCLKPGHFTHVFIDEAGYCTEPESMISAVNLAIERGGQVRIASVSKLLKGLTIVYNFTIMYNFS